MYRNRKWIREPLRFLALGLLPAFLLWGAPPGWTQASPPGGAEVLPADAGSGDKAQIASQLANVKRLLETSSGARRVMGSDNELAKKIRVHALERFRGAGTAYKDGDYTTAERLLREAAQTMFQAIRILGTAKEVVQKKIGDFEGRAESTRVLLEALQRIASEEGTQGNAAKTVAGVERTMAAARELLGAGKYDQARRLLDGGYEMAKAAVERLRDGKTLVRTLKFDSDEDEYRYELDRNDTHQMLVRVLLQEKGPQASTTALVEPFVQRAGDLRRQAEQRAGGGDYREAIRLLELATKELVRAIRGAGLYIPG